VRQLKSKDKSMLIIFFNFKGIVHKEYVLADTTANFAYCCNVLRRLRENVLRLRLEIWRQKYWLLHHNAPSHTFFFTSEFSTKKHIHPPPNLLAWRPEWIYNILDVLKTVNTRGRRLLRGWLWRPVGPKLLFHLMATLVPGIMDTTTFFRVYFFSTEELCPNFVQSRDKWMNSSYSLHIWLCKGNILYSVQQAYIKMRCC
jgi:hypothetical protein